MLGERQESQLTSVEVRHRRIGRFGVPPGQLVVVGMSGIGDRLKELLVARRPAHVLGRAPPFSFDQLGIELALQEAVGRLCGQPMPPVVTEVVSVAEWGAACGRERLLEGGFVGRRGLKAEVWVRQAPA